MSKRAEEAARKKYPIYWARAVMPDGSTIDFDASETTRNVFKLGYEQAEKDTIERAIAWLKENANKYIVDLTPTYPDAPANIIVGGMCWEHLKDYLQNEGAKK